MGFYLVTAIGLFFLVLPTTEAIVTKQENSLAGPYEVDGSNMAWWDLAGTAQLAYNAIRLTTDEQEKAGGLWNNFPNIMNDWEFHIQFHIHGKGVNLNGDGMAIWYVREPHIQGPVFGYRDYFHGLGLFIDTFEDPAHPHNHKHPYISVVVNDGSQHYEHDAEGTVAQIGGCHLPVRNLEWPARIAISYINQVLSVFTDAEGTESWSQCFSSHGVLLPTGYFFGVSASTGLVTDNHDVISITTLDMSTEGKPYEDRTHVVPYAAFVQIPRRPKKVEAPIEHPPKAEPPIVHHEEQIVQVHPVPETQPEVPHHRQESQPAPEVHHHHIEPEVIPIIPEVLLPPEHKHEAEPPKVAEQKPKVAEQKPKVTKHPKAEHRATEGEPEKPVSFLRKAVYLAGIGVLLYVAIAMFRQYMARRRERIQKRLY